VVSVGGMHLHAQGRQEGAIDVMPDDSWGALCTEEFLDDLGLPCSRHLDAGRPDPGVNAGARNAVEIFRLTRKRLPCTV